MMMQPTVLPNAEYIPRPRDPYFAAWPRATSSKYEELEQLAIETAELENKEQGFTPPPTVVSLPPVIAVNAPRVIAAKAKPKATRKPKRVVRAPLREPMRESWHSWGSQVSSGPQRNQWFW
jgi:hypothetical protein